MTNATPTAVSNPNLRQRIITAIATTAFILAMLLGGGAPHTFDGKPQPTPTAVQTTTP